MRIKKFTADHSCVTILNNDKHVRLKCYRPDSMNEPTNHWKDACNKFCVRCILRHVCFDWQWIRKEEKEIAVHLSEEYQFNFSSLNQPCGDTNGTGDDVNCSCRSCLGILQTSFMHLCVQKIDDAILKDLYQFDHFQPQYFLPVQLQVFGLYSLKYFKKHFPELAKGNNIPDVKEVFKVNV